MSSTMRVAPLRWGIFSAGEISSDWASSFRAYLSPNEHQLISVAARNKYLAKKFATEHHIPQFHASYEELAKDPEIDVVYIGTVHPFHLTLGKLALDNGKHVLCEKPLGVNTRETMELIGIARKKNLFLMEGIWSRFFPAYDQLREELKKKTVGDIYQLNAGMGLVFKKENWRLWDKEKCAGTVLNLGTYTSQLASLVFNAERPVKILGAGHLNEHGIDVSSSVTLIYSNFRTASLQTHMKVEFPNEAYIIGTKGVIKIGPKFWCPTELVTPTRTYRYDIPVVSKPTHFWNTAGLAYECAEVGRCIRLGIIESPLMSHAESILLAEVKDEIRAQIGVFYQQDAS